MARSDQKLSVIFFGRRTVSAMRVVKALARTHRVVGIVESQPKSFQPPPWWVKLLSGAARRTDLSAFARRKHIPYFLMTSRAGPRLHRFITALKPDAGAIAGMVYLLPESILSLFPRGMLNSHPSLLPKYRGPVPLFWTYYHQDRQAGATIHYVGGGEDDGDIVRQVPLRLNLNQSVQRFEQRYAHVAAREMCAAMDDLAAGTIRRTSQRHLPCPFRARLLVKGENPIDFARWPLRRIFHALCGADGVLQLLPKRPFPWTFLEFTPVGHSPEPKSAEWTPRFRRDGLSFYIQTAHGVIHLRPRLSVRQLRLGWRRLVRSRRRSPDVPRIA